MSAGPASDGSWILDALRYGELQDECRREMATLLLSLLEVMDSFDRVLAQDRPADDAHGVVDSCRLIARQLAVVLERAKVQPTRCLGQAVDLEAHQVVGVRASTAEQADVVLEVVRRGYEWDGRLLRVAQVVVGRSNEEGSA